MKLAKAKETNVIRLENGATITPELHAYYSKADGGHHVRLRVSYQRRSIRLHTHLYVEKKFFDEDTKRLRQANRQVSLHGYLVRAQHLVKDIGAGDLAALQQAWTFEQRHQKLQNVEVDWERQYQDECLDVLVVRRDALQAELDAVLEQIDKLAAQTKRVVSKRAATGQQKKDFAAAKEMFFTVGLAGRKQRDQDAFAGWYNVLEQCAAHQKVTLTLEVFDMKFYWLYADYILHVKGNYNNSFGSHVKKLKQFIKFAELNGFAVNPAYKDKNFKILDEKKLIVYLDDEELNAIWAYKQVAPHFAKHIDLCLFQNLTGLRVSDARRQHVITREKNNEFLKGVTIKNKGEYKIPLSLDPRIKEILRDNEFNMRLLNEPQYNRELKVLVQEVYAHEGWEMPQFLIKRYKLANFNEFSQDKYELISSHSCRRGFITRHLNSGDFNETDVLKMLGSTDLKELQKYVEVEGEALAAKASANHARRSARKGK